MSNDIQSDAASQENRRTDPMPPADDAAHSPENTPSGETPREPETPGRPATAADSASTERPSAEDVAAPATVEGESTDQPPADEPSTEEPSDVEPSDEEPSADQPSAEETSEDGPAPSEPAASDDDDDDDEDFEDVEPLEEIHEEEESDESLTYDWYIIKVQVNREESIRDALSRRIQIHGQERFFKDVIVPTEDVAEFNKSGKRRIVKKKLYPGYLMVHMSLNDETWFLVRETPGINDFTGSAGKPTPMLPDEVERILHSTKEQEKGEAPVKTAIPFKIGDRVRVKEGYFENFEGEVESIDEANGRVTVMIVIFGRSTPVELEHWQIESV